MKALDWKLCYKRSVLRMQISDYYFSPAKNSVIGKRHSFKRFRSQIITYFSFSLYRSYITTALDKHRRPMPEIVSEDKLQKYVLNHLSKLNQNADPDKCGSRIIGMKSAFKKYGLFALLFFWGGDFSCENKRFHWIAQICCQLSQFL